MGGDYAVPKTLQLQEHCHRELPTAPEGLKGAAEHFGNFSDYQMTIKRKEPAPAGRGGAGRDVGGEKVLTRRLPTARRGVP